MNSIDIFGDSFSDKNVRFRDTITWLDILEENYKIKNFSLYGVGAQYCVEKLMELSDYSDYLLFMIPDINRLNLEYVKDKTKQSQTNIIFKQVESNSWDFGDLESDEPFLVDHAEKIFSDYKGFYNTELHKILEPLIVQYVFSRAIYYKKILIWGSSGLGYPFRFYNTSIHIPSNCHIVEGSLNLISLKEEDIKVQSEVHFLGQDIRNNHLADSNHVVLANQIQDYFEHNIEPSPSRFNKNLYVAS